MSAIVKVSVVTKLRTFNGFLHRGPENGGPVLTVDEATEIIEEIARSEVASLALYAGSFTDEPRICIPPAVLAESVVTYSITTK